MILYRTFLKTAEAEQTIEKSRFIAYAEPVQNRAEAEAFFARLRARYHDARHCVPAFILGEKGETRWASDDGEPQGTSGGPILKLLEGEELTFVAVMVVRYFGGIKLGPGGLARAYSGTARLAVAEAGVAVASAVERWNLRIGYSEYQKLVAAAGEIGVEVTNPVFAEDVQLGLSYLEAEAEAVRRYVNDLTSGRLTDLGTAKEIRLLPAI